MSGLASRLSVSGGGVLHNLSVDHRLLIVPWPLDYHLPHNQGLLVEKRLQRLLPRLTYDLLLTLYSMGDEEDLW